MRRREGFHESPLRGLQRQKQVLGTLSRCGYGGDSVELPC